MFNTIREGGSVESRGYVCRKYDETRCIVFSRARTLWGNSTSYTLVYDVVDYSETEQGSHRGTYYALSEAIRFAKL
jgi:hypothetical protein